jgi:osmotically-inducible protein OsmY
MTLLKRQVNWLDGKSADRLDFELQSLVNGYLIDRDPYAFRSLQVDVDHGTVTLSGQVRTYYEKQIALSCANLAGVLNLVDHLAVPEWEVQDNEYPFTL